MLDDRAIGALVERLGVEPQRTGGVLLVDDEPLNLAVLRDVLEDDFTVHVAGSGEEALGVIERGVPLDVVVSDQRMPGLTGVELLALLRSRRPDLAGIVLTAYGDVSVVEAAINRAGAFRFMRKPWEPEEIRAAIAHAAEYTAQRRTIARLVTLLAERGEALDASLKQLKAQQAALLDLERLGTVGRLAAGLTHDLKNVIVALRAAEWEMAKTTVSEPLREIVTLGMAGVDNLLRTFQSLLEYSRTGALEVQLATVTPAVLVTDALALSRMDLAFRLRRVESSIDPGLPTIAADRQKLTQVLVNLVRNALHATENGARVRVTAARRPTGEVELAVEDEGPGVAPGDRERIFEPFVSSKGDAGLGLGLYMSRLIVESHGGRISAGERPGGGARFEILLPPRGGGAGPGEHAPATEGVAP